MNIGNFEFNNFSLLRAVRWYLIAFIGVIFFSSTLEAQWRIPTPRDTVYVPANQKSFVVSKFALTSGVDMWVSAAESYTELDGSSKFGIDASYAYSVNGSNLFPEALTPPTYAGKVHKYAFTVSTIPNFNEAPFRSIENSYQSSHIYTQRYPCQGQRFQFRILADKDADYPVATGGINVKMARWTAGIAIESVNVDFANVSIGTSSTILDSIASYGLDPLQIDSIKIVDTSGLGDFSFISERGKRFTLQTEQSDEIKILFSPSTRGIITAELHIFSHNADPASRQKIVYLRGFGIAPDFGVGPHELDFGKVRIGYPTLGHTNISNAKGNATLHVNTDTKYYQTQPSTGPLVFGFAAPSKVPTDITPGSIGQINTLFNPVARVKYEGWLQVRADNVNLASDSVHLFGEGAQPVPALSPVPKNGSINFGIVYNGNNSTNTIVLKNTGNWTLSVALAKIYGAQGAAFSFSPNDTSFIVEPDSSRTFTILFHPRIGIADSLPVNAYFALAYDDNTIDTVFLKGMEILSKLSSCDTLHDFGKIRLGKSRTDSVSCIFNRGNAQIGLQEEDVSPKGQFDEVGRIGGLEGGQRSAILCKFAPVVPGPAAAWFYYQGNGKRDSVLLTGIGAVAKAIFTPSPLSFGIVPSNKIQKLSTILKDSGDYPLFIDTIIISGQNASDFKLVAPTVFPDTLLPDSTLNIQVQFFTNDLTGAVHQATLCIYYSDSSTDCIPLEAIEEAQYLQFAQSSINFGKQRIKTHATKPAVFRNGSNKVLTVGAVTATSTDNVYTVTDSLKPVSPQLTGSVPVDFFPQTRGSFIGYLHAFGGEIKTDSIQLRGQGVAPLPYFSDTVLNFGIVKLNIPFSKTMSLYDTGDWTLKAEKIELVGNKYGEFSYRKGLQNSIKADTIAEQAHADYVVTFTPNQTIVYHTANLVFTFDDGTQGIVKLVGYDESPQLVLDDDTVNFGKIRVGTSAASHTVHIVSTSAKDLIAQTLDISTAAPAGTFAAKDILTGSIASGPVTVPLRTLYPIDLTFKPQSIGIFTAMFISTGADIKNNADTIFINGIGAAPVPIASSKTLDFGSLFAGYPGTRSFTLSDSGNWILSIKKVEIIGPNKADFSLRSLPSQFDIPEGGMNSVTVDFKAVTPYQASPIARSAQIVFTLDDSSTYTVDLIEQDIAPLPVDLEMDNMHARIGDYVTPYLRMKNSIPDSLHILGLKGSISFDPMVVDLDRSGVQLGTGLTSLGNWKINTNPSDPAGTFTYELIGTSAPLTAPGSLFRLKFTPHSGVTPGSMSPLTHTSFTFPQRSELAPLVDTGMITIDSACGNTHIVSGEATANMVDQNMPNPFGSSSGETQIPFDIGFENTPVTIRILDLSGREVARPLDNTIFNQGRYRVKVNKAMLGSTGTFFYEFRAGNAKPVFKKMMVDK
jgi:hypothetical protein